MNGSMLLRGLAIILAYFRSFKVLKETPREFWGAQSINLIDSTAYFALMTVITIFLSQEIGLSDAGAGYIVTLFTSLVTILLLFSGFLTDLLGIRKSLAIAMIIRASTAATIVLLAVFPEMPYRIPLIGTAFVLMAPSSAMVQTVFQATNKRYTNSRSRGAGFNLWFLSMNVGAAAAGLLIDQVRLRMNLGNSWIIGFAVFSSLVGLIILAFFVRTEEQFGDDNRFLAGTARILHTKKARAPLFHFGSFFGDKVFWRLLILISLLLGARATSVYVYLLMPKYWIRTIGEGAAIGTLNALNPIVSVIGIVLFIPIASKFNIFKMLIFGAIVSSLSLFVLALPWQVVGNCLGLLQQILGFDWLQSDFKSSYYAMSIVSMILLSIGELMWAPKLQEYIAVMAPQGREGTYFGLSILPWFITKTIVSLISGHMLNRWVPEDAGTRIHSGALPFWESPEAMWLILGMIALVGPILACFLKGWLNKHSNF